MKRRYGNITYLMYKVIGARPGLEKRDQRERDVVGSKLDLFGHQHKDLDKSHPRPSVDEK